MRFSPRTRYSSRQLSFAGVILVAVVGFVLALVLTAGGGANLIPGGSAACERSATVLNAFASSHHSYSSTDAKDRRTFWNLHAALLSVCPLSGVAYFSTHEMASYLNR